MQHLDIPANTATRGVVLRTVNTVMVKFMFTNPAHIPPGIPQRTVTSISQKETDEYNAIVAAAAGHAELAEVGRVRQGRIDTGDQTVNNLQLVQLGLIRRGLANVMFQLRSCHSYPKPATPTSSRKYVVVLTFKGGPSDSGYYEEATATPEAKEAHKLLNSPEVVSALRSLANTTWQYCHVWDNSRTRKTATINVGGRIPDGRPLHAIAVRGGEIVPVELKAALTEGQE